MPSIFYRFSLDPAKIDAKMAAVIIFVWLAVVVCAVGSVLAHQPRFDERKRWFWILMVVCVPVIGLLVYLPFSHRHEGYPFFRKSKHHKRKVPVASPR
jgi:hypothetical protein